MLNVYEVNKYGIKRIWFHKEDAKAVSSYLLPTIYHEIVCSNGAPLLYDEAEASSFHWRGSSVRKTKIEQYGDINNMGITLDIGAMPVIMDACATYALGKAVCLMNEGGGLIKRLRRIMTKEADEKAVADRIISEMKSSWLDQGNIDIVKEFVLSNHKYRIVEYCHRLNVNIKKLERLCYKYVGIPPVASAQLMKFNAAYKKLAASERTSDVSADLYYDQAHMIKWFKRYLEETPKEFGAGEEYFKLKTMPMSKKYNK